MEREIQEEQEQLRREYKKSEKRKHRRRQEPQLEQDDFDLIEENIGVPVQKKRRLQKNIEHLESPHQQSEEDRDVGKARDIDREGRRRVDL